MNSPYPAYQEEKSEIDLAPMLDIVFIMLIFFVVTAAFIKEQGVPVTLTPTILDKPQYAESIAVTAVDAGRLIGLDVVPISKAE